MDYPGWNASVDGAAAPIWRANAGIRAIPLERGGHRVEMGYRPLSAIIGAAISGMAIIVLGTLIYREVRN
jgi:uncharacterized membrane protein YfhO